MLDAAGRAKDLVRQILAFSRLSTTDRKTVQVGPLVQDVLKLLRATLPATVEIHSTIGVDSGCIYANSTLIHQILVNLCTNACHAMGASGGLLEVTVSGLEAGSPELTKLGGSGQRGCVKISVRDTGEGIPPAVQKHIFDPFFTTKCQGEGTGLGLSVVHEIVTSHGGVIEVDSKPGAGATFRVYLPQTGAREASATAAAPSRSAGGERILVVDDEEPIIKLGRGMLERQGYQVLALTSSEEALELFRSGPGEFDLVLSDVSMPELSGIDLARALIGIRPDIPVILMAGFTEMITEEAAQDMGVRGTAAETVQPRGGHRADSANARRDTAARGDRSRCTRRRLKSPLADNVSAFGGPFRIPFRIFARKRRQHVFCCIFPSPQQLFPRRFDRPRRPFAIGRQRRQAEFLDQIVHGQIRVQRRQRDPVVFVIPLHFDLVAVLLLNRPDLLDVKVDLKQTLAERQAPCPPSAETFPRRRARLQ